MGGGSSKIIKMQLESGSKTAGSQISLDKKDMTFIEFLTALQEPFPLLKDHMFKITWKDPKDETQLDYQITCDNELKVALDKMDDNCLFNIKITDQTTPVNLDQLATKISQILKSDDVNSASVIQEGAFNKALVSVDGQQILKGEERNRVIIVLLDKMTPEKSVDGITKKTEHKL